MHQPVTCRHSIGQPKIGHATCPAVRQGGEAPPVWRELCHLPNVDALDPDLRRRCELDRHRRADIETGGLQPGDTFDDGVDWRDQQGRVALNQWRKRQCRLGVDAVEHMLKAHASKCLRCEPCRQRSLTSERDTA